MTAFILRIKNGNTYDVGVIDLPSSISLEDATAFTLNHLDHGQVLERITNADTKESATLQSIHNA